MKKTLFIIALLLLTGCSEEEKRANSESSYEESIISEESIFKKTGCRVKDVETIELISEQFTDSKGNKYLGGCRKGHVFWFSKYTPNGKLIWDTSKEPEGKILTRAWEAKELSNGDIILGCVVGDKIGSVEIDGIYPTILSAKDGTPKFIKTKDHYIYSYIKVYDDFFICGIDDKELALYPFFLERQDIKISNEGEILLSLPEFNVPEENSFWINNEEFIQIGESSISRMALDKRVSPKWSNNISIGSVKSYSTESKEEDGVLIITYHVVRNDDSKEDVEYIIYADNGDDFTEITDIKLEKNEITVRKGKEFKINATITPSEISESRLHWTSSNEKIASINGGTISAISEGKCVITASNFKGTIQRKCNVTVSNSEIIFDKTNPSMLLIGKASNIKYSTYPANLKILWSSSDSNIVSVDNNGCIIGKEIGTAIITAKADDESYAATCKITVSDISDFIDIKFSSSSISIINGYVTGSVFSEITNNSSEMIKVTKLTVVDTSNNLIIAMADQSLLGNLQPKASFNIGSNTLKMVYYPLFAWEYEYNGKSYKTSHIFGKESYRENRAALNYSNRRIQLIKK